MFGSPHQLLKNQPRITTYIYLLWVNQIKNNQIFIIMAVLRRSAQQTRGGAHFRGLVPGQHSFELQRNVPEVANR